MYLEQMEWNSRVGNMICEQMLRDRHSKVMDEF